MQTVRFEKGFVGWRNAARVLLAHEIPPGDVQWQEEGRRSALLWEDETLDWQSMIATSPKRVLNVSRRFLEMAETVSYHRDLEKWQLLYSII
ncbi:MAG: hypothetical protein EON54_02470, partial [Alcaligenaceae bacterium]